MLNVHWLHSTQTNRRWGTDETTYKNIERFSECSRHWIFDERKSAKSCTSRNGIRKYSRELRFYCVTSNWSVTTTARFGLRFYCSWAADCSARDAAVDKMCSQTNFTSFTFRFMILFQRLIFRIQMSFYDFRFFFSFRFCNFSRLQSSILAMKWICIESWNEQDKQFVKMVGAQFQAQPWLIDSMEIVSENETFEIKIMDITDIVHWFTHLRTVQSLRENERAAMRSDFGDDGIHCGLHIRVSHCLRTDMFRLIKSWFEIRRTEFIWLRHCFPRIVVF